MASNDWVGPVFALGVIGIGGALLLPTIMKSLRNSEEPEEDVIPLSAAEQAIQDTSSKSFEEGLALGKKNPDVPIVDLSDLVDDIGAKDDAYLISDEDFDRLDISKRDRRFLNKRRKIRDARLERVLYGDNMPQPYIYASYAANSVNPYGVGPYREFGKLGWSESQSRVNTQKNTVNLY